MGNVEGGASTRASIATDAIAVVAVAMSQIGLAISLAVLVFVGAADPALPRAISSFVFGGAIVCGFIGWRSRIPIVISGAQDTAAVVLVAVAASVSSGSAGDPALNVVVLVAASTMVTGVVMALLGYFQLSDLVRYLPTTVVAAFVAGTGWLLFKGGLDIMVSDHLGLDDIGRLFDWNTAKFWLPGVVLGILTLVLGHSVRIPTSAASLTVIAAVATFLVVTAAFSSFDDAEAQGWLIGPFPQAEGLQLITPGELADASWDSIGAATPGIVAVVLVSVIGLLLNLSGFELINRSRIDLDSELRTAGLTNILIAPFGGLVGYHLLGDTGLAKNLGARTRAIAIGAAAIGVAVALGGTELVGYLPRFIAGGLLTGVGLNLLSVWITNLRSSGRSAESILSILIVVAIAAIGILEGIAFGIVAACAIFVFRYSRIDPVRAEFSGAEMRSRVDRSPAATATLTLESDKTLVYVLQGYLFFGSASSLSDRILSRVDQAEPLLSSLIVDLRRVSGLDLSAFGVLRRLYEDVTESGVQVLWSGLAANTRDTFERIDPDLLTSSFVFADLDLALEAAESRILDRHAEPLGREDPIDQEIDLSPELLGFFERQSFPAGTRVLEQGDSSDAMYVVVRGTLTAWRRSELGTVSRLRRFSTGSIIGEISFIRGGERTADVFADTDVVLLQLSRDSFDEMRASQPDAALELQDFLLEHVSKRLTLTTISLASAMDDR